MKPRVMTVGETAVVLDPIGDRCELGSGFRLGVSGAESNFGIALKRLGLDVTWISRLGGGPLGDLVERTLGAEGLDLRYVLRDEAAPTAVVFKIRRSGSTSLIYYRHGSAASRMEPADVPDDALANVRGVHLTGITAAIGEGPRLLIESVARRARASRAVTTFDLNYRPALWSAGDAAAACGRVLPNVDWVLCGEAEARLLFGGDQPVSVIDHLREAGASGVVLRVGADGALVAAGAAVTHIPAVPVERIIDDIGAGDAFDAGFTYGLAIGLDPSGSAEIGNVLAAKALSSTGEWETMPTIDELRRLVPAAMLPSNV